MANQLRRTYRRVYGIRRWGSPPTYSSHELFLKGGQSNASSREQDPENWDYEEGGVDEPDDRILEYSVGKNSVDYPDLPGLVGVPPEGEIFRMGDVPNQDDRGAELDPSDPEGPRGGVSYPLHLSKRRLRRFGDKIQQQLWVNLATGGTGFSDNRWNRGDDLYVNFIRKANDVQTFHPQFKLRAFIWSNSENEMQDGYTGQQFYDAQKGLIDGLRMDVMNASEETPFIFTMPPANFIDSKHDPAGGLFARDIVDASFQLAKDMENVYYLDHGALTAPGDGVHFDTLQIRAIGAQLESLLYRIGQISEAPGPITVS